MNTHPYQLPPAETPAQSAARDALQACITEFYRIANFHKEQYIRFWNNPQVSPKEFCKALGERGQEWLIDAATSKDYIVALAARYKLPIEDVLPPEFSAPRLSFEFLPDGHISVVEVEGLDAWGRPIPAPEEEQP